MPRQRIGFWYRLAAVLVKPPLVILFKRDWRGMENIPAHGGFITAINHNSYLDPLAYAHFQYNTGRVPRFLAKSALFKVPVIGRMFHGLQLIPVYRESTDAANAFRAAVSAIDKGECVAFYPEGTLTRDPDQWPMRAKTGAARVALLTKAPVIPVAQWGANAVLPPYAGAKRLRLFPRKTFKVVAGPPVDLSAYYGQEPTAEVLRAATDTIMAAVTELLADVRQEPVPAGRAEQPKGGAAEGLGSADRTDHEADGTGREAGRTQHEADRTDRGSGRTEHENEGNAT
ncbi:lysophospholipid acyltransferase family protein [Streptomyces buecherae]|uniref:lysophospholipid acyltransferase family protein n=1 Tax=Streptomyces buecherae TaxID=2763006 RepID=UPI00368F9B00